MTAAAPSVIQALHARYEAAMDEYHAIDVAELELSNDNAGRLAAISYQNAKAASDAECDALRMAILYQVPSDQADALVLQFHIYIALDLAFGASKGVPPADKLALEVATDTLLDFMCGSAELQLEHYGRQIASSAKRVADRRRMRTGQLGAAA